MNWKEFGHDVHRLKVSYQTVGYVMKVPGDGDWHAFTWWHPRISLGLYDSLAVAKKAVEDAWCASDDVQAGPGKKAAA